MSELAVKAVLSADARQLVGATNEAAAGLDKVKASVKGVGDQARQSVKDTDGLSKSQTRLGEESQKTTNVIKLSNHHMANLSYQMNDVVSGLAMGQSPFMILTQQGGQFVQLMQQSGVGPLGLLKAMGSTILSVITPTALLGTTALAMAGSLAYAAVRAGEVRRELEGALSGIGRAAGATADELEDIAQRTAVSTGISVQAARDMEVAYVKTGKVSAESLESLMATTVAYARVTGMSFGEATEALTKAFSDPAKAGLDLLANMGALNEKTRLLISDLVAQGNQAQALKTLQDRVNEAVAEGTDKTTAWGRAWQAAGNIANSALEFLMRGFKKTPDVDLAAHYREQIASMKADNPNGFRDRDIAIFQRKLTEVEGRLQVNQAKADKQAADVARNTASLQFGDITRRYDTFGTQLHGIDNDKINVQQQLAKGYITSAQAQDALADIERKRSEVLKAQHASINKVSDAERERLARIKSLLGSAPQTLASAREQADAQEMMTKNIDAGSAAQQRYADRLAITRATLPYVTALLTAQGSEAAKLKVIIADLSADMERGQRAMRGREAIMGVRSALGSISPYADNELQAAAQEEARRQLDDWRNSTLDNLALVEGATERYGDTVALIFNDRMAQLYEEDLRRRTDWAAGIERANLDIVRSHQDMASRSEEFLRGWDRTAEDVFANFGRTGKFEIGGLIDFAMEQFARLAYQRYLAQSFNSLGGGILDMIGSVVGSAMGAPTAGILDAGSTVRANVANTGWDTSRGAAPSHRFVHSAYFDDAVRHHTGTGRIGANERPVIVEMSEKILTARQSDMVEAALSRPQVFNVGTQSQSGNAPAITIRFLNNSGVPLKGEQGQQRQTPGGGFEIDVFVEMVEKKIADNMYRGSSPVGDTIEGVYGARRSTG